MPDAPDPPTLPPEPPGAAMRWRQPLAERTRRRSPLDVVLRIACGLIVAGIAVAFLIPSRICTLCPDRSDTAQNQMAGFGGAIDFFHLEDGALPPTLAALTVPSPKSGEAYIAKIPTDPWGVAYSYRILDAEKRTYEIRSAGPDHRFGTDDDLVYSLREQR